MKISKRGLIMFAAAIASFGVYSSALALTTGVGVGVGASSSVGVGQGSANASATSSNNSNAGSNDNIGGAAGTTGSANADAHRSAVSVFVKNLLSVANREPGIGDEVRVIAKEQNDSASTTALAIVEVESRSNLKTFLIGADYKNLGFLRSQIAKTAGQIEKLKELASRAVSTEDKAEISAQITAMENEQVQIDNFIKANEDKFSLFGWFTKLFQ